jgi:hypothetical protein
LPENETGLVDMEHQRPSQFEVNFGWIRFISAIKSDHIDSIYNASKDDQFNNLKDDCVVYLNMTTNTLGKASAFLLQRIKGRDKYSD